MPDNLATLRAQYARLKGIEQATFGSSAVRTAIVRDFNSIVRKISSVTSEDFADFLVNDPIVHDESKFIPMAIFDSKLKQTINVLNYSYNLSNRIIEIGSLYNAIHDEELKNRCSDLLSAVSAFDRVINQATLVLEDRIRRKLSYTGGLTGAQLINSFIKADLSTTTLKLSDDEGEHRGFCDIMRGIMSALRNPTHHTITEKFTREDALKICGFIDNLLRIVDGGTVIRSV